MGTILSIDLGTSALKLILVDSNGKLMGSVTESYNIQIPQPGWAEQKPGDWIGALIKGVKRLKQESPDAMYDVAGIGITGQMHGLVSLDKNGVPVCNAIIWADKRCEEEVGELEANFSLDTWMNMTGNRPNVSFTLPKILWLRHHVSNIFNRVSHFLLPKDYVRFWLTGNYATDPTDASATLMFDIVNKCWADDVLTAFDIERAMLPDILGSSDIAGVLSHEAAGLLDIRPGIPVICGLGDAEAQAVGNCVVDDDSWLCIIGTGGQIFTPVDRVIVDKKARVHTLCHGVPDKWHMMGATLSAGASLQWLAEHIFQVRGYKAYDELVNTVDLTSCGSDGLIFLPYLFGERTPIMDPKAKGAFIGFDFHHTKSHMVSAVLEGVLFSLYESINILADLKGKYPEAITITGGAAQSMVWRQMAANIFGMPIIRHIDLAGSTYGAAILTAVGLAIYPSIKACAEAWIESGDVTHPNMVLHDNYLAYFDVYKGLYSSLKDSFDKLDTLYKGSAHKF